MEKERAKSLVLWFDEIGIEDVSLVGGKNASLGEMLRDRKSQVKIPPGFAITSYAYRYLLEKAGVLKDLKRVMHGLNIRDSKALENAGRRARKLILDCAFPPEMENEITTAYRRLSSLYHVKNLDVAVRSSATAEDLPEASFAGQQESFLHIKGVKQLLDACRRCFASLFTNRAIVYRAEHHFDHFDVYLSIGVQKMVRSDLASAGVIVHPRYRNGFRDVVFITGSYGLGESVVQGSRQP